MGAFVGLKERFLAEKRELLSRVRKLYRDTGSWEEVEKLLKEEFKEELSFFRPNLFTYFLFIGGSLILPLLYMWKVAFEPGTTAHFIARLLFVIAAMFALKGIVGHYVVVFLNRDRFEAELKALKASLEGGKNGEQPN
ncbi:hypothetical protein Theam_0496 [Thermovibrio ammonificans HB-1]|uniref:Uncharacterized protein n=1 Tax=Thermovibrio ammonificans (strain DSM 15698 / JCM 12110 / HB-1) TaxID=648996 RepID=E8T5J3_THEA1|nr:hypothetical protein [Thermovibrio ammonificans]ADU96468.1 hypothetical protein Theam_0496 [Thermovibrio ammonificans HB-1]